MTDLLRFTADVDLQAAEGKPPRLTGTAYSGGVMKITGFGNVVVDVAGMEIPASLPLLAEHDAGIVGTGSPAASNGTLLVNGTLISGETSNRIVAISQGGVGLSLSIGAESLEFRRFREGETIQANGRSHTAPAGGVTFVTKSRLREISVVVVGADPGASAAIAAKGTQMSDTVTTTESQELLRAKLVTEFTADHLEYGDQFADLEVKADSENWDADRLNVALIRAARPQVTGNVRGSGPTGTQDVLEAGLLLRAGFETAAVKAYGENNVEAAHRSRITSLVDLCGAALRAEGRTVPHGRDAMIRASFSTMILPNVLSNTVGRALIQSFNDTTSNWRSFCAIKSAATFRTQTDIRPSSFETLEELGAAG